VTAEELVALAEKYPIGWELRFAAGPEVAQDHDGAVLASGTITGPPLVCRNERDEVEVYVPAWVVRDHGREATTVLVHSGNVVAAVPKVKP
jgi:hypothetical protein